MGWRIVGDHHLGKHVVSRALLNATLLLAAVSATSCFDVHTVDPGWLIDDFDDGKNQPADPNFSPWGCYTFGPDTNENYSCGHDSDTLDGSPYSFFLDFTIDETQEHSGAGIQTRATAPENFTRFSELVFSAKLESGNPPLPTDAIFYAQIGCSTALAADGSSPGDLFVTLSIDHDNYWKTFSPKLTDYSVPSWESTQISGGTVGCLERADSFNFYVDAQVPYGQSGMGILHIDDIYLQ
jgi:hypothetical protein